MPTTLTIDVSDEIATRFHALPKEAINHFATAVLPDWIESTEETNEPTDDEPIDEVFVAELIAADEEAARTGYAGTITLEELRQQMEADSGPGFIERLRARLAAEGLTAAQVIGAPTA